MTAESSWGGGPGSEGASGEQCWGRPADARLGIWLVSRSGPAREPRQPGVAGVSHSREPSARGPRLRAWNPRTENADTEGGSAVARVWELAGPSKFESFFYCPAGWISRRGVRGRHRWPMG